MLGRFLCKKRKDRNFVIDENGKNISGGEKQRICLARSLYKDPEILILDEATSSLDISIENEILTRIFKVFKDKTIIFISHRPNTLRNCNKIFEVSNMEIKQKK